MLYCQETVFSSKLGRNVEEARRKVERCAKKKNTQPQTPSQTQQRSNLPLPLKPYFRRPSISHEADAGNDPAQQEAINICPKSHTSHDAE